MSVWKSVANQVSGLAKHVAHSVVSEPVEVIKDAVGANMEQGKQTTQQPTDPGQVDPLKELSKAGFKTPEDYTKYQGLSQQKDELEVQMVRKQLEQQWGLNTDLKSGMIRAQQEWEQKEAQRKQIEEKKEEQKKEFEFQKKQQEDIGLKAAKSEASAENKAWGAG